MTRHLFDCLKDDPRQGIKDLAFILFLIFALVIGCVLLGEIQESGTVALSTAAEQAGRWGR